MSHTITIKCNGCGACVKMCPSDAISGEKDKLHLISAALCINCGVCGKICPEAAINDQLGAVCRRMKKSEWKKPRFDLKACVACINCIETCPTGSIGFTGRTLPNDPHNYPCLENERTCIGCGFCATECPVEAIVMV
jgi:ferredoxin